MKSNSGRILKIVASGIGFTVVVIVLIMGLAGFFHPKIGAHVASAEQHRERPVGNTPLIAARAITVPIVEEAVGTIRAIHQTSVASKLLAKVVAVNVQAGQAVERGDVLVRLDQEGLQARLDQALAAVAAARAACDQAQVEHDRIKRLVEQNVASAIEFERAQTALKSTQAGLEQADQARRESETILGYATITSPFSGIVIDKQVEFGDTVTPGQVVVTLYDPTRMQLVASVRESLTQRLEPGQTIGVRVDALDKICDGRINEIVPEAEAASRSFQVKVTGPCPPGIYSGMFGRLLIPLDEEQVLVMPRAAVRRVGQLKIVDVADGEVLRRRVVQLGRSFGDDVEILAGVRVGERVAVPADAADSTREGV